MSVQPLSERLLVALVAAVEHSCAIVKKQLDGRNWHSAANAATVADNLTQTFLRVTADNSAKSAGE